MTTLSARLWQQRAGVPAMAHCACVLRHAHRKQDTTKPVSIPHAEAVQVPGRDES